MVRKGWLGLAGLVGTVAGLGQVVAPAGGPGTIVRVGPGVVQAEPLRAPAGQVDTRDADIEKIKKQLADWPQLGRYAAANQQLPKHVAGRVVFYGDSITDNWAKPSNAGTFFLGKPYVGRGISGQTTPQMVVRFRQDVIDLHPEAVVILAGTNDVAGNTGPETPEMVEGYLATMAELARVHGIRVVLCSIMPVVDYPWRKGLEPSPKIKQINAWMKGYAAKEGFAYVDYYSAMDDGTGAAKAGLTVDGVHPTAAGYAVMEPLAEAAIERR